MPGRTEPRLSRSAQRVLAMLSGNGGYGVFKVGNPRLAILGPPDKQYAHGPAAVVTSIARRGLVLLGDGGMLFLTDDGRTEVARLGIGRRPKNPRQAAIAHAAVCFMEVRNALDDISGDSLALPPEIPAALRPRISRLKIEAAEIWDELFTLSQGQPLNQKRAA